MTGAPCCHLPPCGGGRRRGAAPGEGYHGGGRGAWPPPSPTLLHKGGGSRRESAVEIREGVRGSFGNSRRRTVRQRLLHRSVGEPFAVDRHGVALPGDVAALCKKFLRVVAGIDREALGAAAAGDFFQRLD